MTKRKTYSKEFKLDAISLVVEQGYSKAEAARNLGINANILAVSYTQVPAKKLAGIFLN